MTRISVYIILIAFVTTFVVAPPALGAGAAPVDKGRKDRPKDPPDPPPDTGQRPDRPKPPPRDDGGGTRPPREKPDEPRPPQDNGNNDDHDYQPPDHHPWPRPHPRPPCHRCGQRDCWLDHDGYYYSQYSESRPVSTLAGLYLLGSASMMFINLMYVSDVDSRGTGPGIAGLVLGGIGLVSAGITEDPDSQARFFLTGMVLIGLAAANLTSDPPIDEPAWETGPTVKSRGVSFTLSF